MTQITGTSGSTGNLPLKGAPTPAAPAAPGPALATDGRAAAKDAPPTNVALAMKVIRGLELPEKPMIMFRDATRDAWVRDAAHTLVRAEKVLDILREAALDPRTPVSDADWSAAKAKVKALGQAVAAADKNHVRGEAFEAQLAPQRDAVRAALRYPEAPADPKAREAWRVEGEALLGRAREAVREMEELRDDTGVDPFLSRSLRGEVLPSPPPDYMLDMLEKRLQAPPPTKLDTFVGLIKAVGAIAEAVEIAPNGELRARRR